MSSSNLSPEQNAVIKRVTLRLMPLLTICFMIAYLDRSNISVAALTMNHDLGLTATMYGIGAGIFFGTYILFEIPSNLALAKVGARRWIARIMISWGVVASAMALIQTAHQFYGMRLLLGACEAGFTPGVIYYLSYWYPARQRGQVLSFFYIGATLASVIGLPVSGALLGLNGLGGIAGWRWLFLLEGIPAVVLGFVVLFWLPESPKQARWLSPSESTWLTDTISAESALQPITRSHGWGKALADSKVLALALFWLLQAFGTIGLTLFLPLVVKGLSSQTNMAISLLSALPFLVACVFMYINARHSDKSGERALHLGLPLMAAGILLAAAVIATQMGSLGLAYTLLLLAVGSELGFHAGVLGCYHRACLRDRRSCVDRVDQCGGQHRRCRPAADHRPHSGRDRQLRQRRADDCRGSGDRWCAWPSPLRPQDCCIGDDPDYA